MQILISCVCDTAIFVWFNYRDLRGNKHNLKALGMCLFMAGITFVMNKWKTEIIIFRVLVNFLFYFSMHRCFCRERTWNYSFERTLALLNCLVLSKLFIVIMLMLFLQNHEFEHMWMDFSVWAFTMPFGKMLEVILLKVVNYLSTGNIISIKMLALYVALMCLMLGYMAGMVYLFSYQRFDHRAVKVVFAINNIFIVVIFLGIFVLFRISSISRRQEKEIKMLSDRNKIQMKCYEEINAYKRQIQHLYHDLKNQAIIAGGIKSERVCKKYVESLDAYFAELLINTDSGNEILDVLIQNKLKSCREKEILFEYKVDFSKGGFISLVDVGIIYGNVIDNAIEACERVKQKERKIELVTYKYEEFIYIHIENPVEEIKEEKGRLLTLKSNKKVHGIGLENVNSALNRYHGSMKYQIAGGNFKLTIIIPINA